jgi:hypothetical protein
MLNQYNQIKVQFKTSSRSCTNTQCKEVQTNNDESVQVRATTVQEIAESG